MDVVTIKDWRRPGDMSAEDWETVPEHAKRRYNLSLQNYDEALELYDRKETVKNRRNAEKHRQLYLENKKWLMWFFVPPPVEPPPLDAKTKELTCCICLVKQVNRCLPCGHTLCSLCLPEMLKHNNCACPTCRIIFDGKSVFKLFI